jgi:hypothetical protein
LIQRMLPEPFPTSSDDAGTRLTLAPALASSIDWLHAVKHT